MTIENNVTIKSYQAIDDIDMDQNEPRKHIFLIVYNTVSFICLMCLFFWLENCRTETAECDVCTGLLTNIVCSDIDCNLFFNVYCAGSSSEQTMITTNSSLVNNYTLNNTYDIYPYCGVANDNNFSLEPTYYSYCEQSNMFFVLALLTSIIMTSCLICCIFTIIVGWHF